MCLNLDVWNSVELLKYEEINIYIESGNVKYNKIKQNMNLTSTDSLILIDFALYFIT